MCESYEGSAVRSLINVQSYPGKSIATDITNRVEWLWLNWVSLTYLVRNGHHTLGRYLGLTRELQRFKRVGVAWLHHDYLTVVLMMEIPSLYKKRDFFQDSSYHPLLPTPCCGDEIWTKDCVEYTKSLWVLIYLSQCQACITPINISCGNCLRAYFRDSKKGSIHDWGLWQVLENISSHRFPLAKESRFGSLGSNRFHCLINR